MYAKSAHEVREDSEAVEGPRTPTGAPDTNSEGVMPTSLASDCAAADACLWREMGVDGRWGGQNERLGRNSAPYWAKDVRKIRAKSPRSAELGENPRNLGQNRVRTFGPKSNFSRTASTGAFGGPGRPRVRSKSDPAENRAIGSRKLPNPMLTLVVQAPVPLISLLFSSPDLCSTL